MVYRRPYTSMIGYQEFDKTFNKRDCRGVVLECSVITLKGEVIKRGTIEEIDDFMDLQTDPIWKNHKFMGNALPDGREVIATNVGSWDDPKDSYANLIKNKLQF